MNKKLLIFLGIILILLAAYYFLYLGKAREGAEEGRREENPIFHSVQEGGECRPGEGDCEVGLTCGEESICVKP